MVISLQAVAVAALVTTATAGRIPNKSTFNWDDIKRVIAFGDSYTWIQGSHGYPGYSFIGDFRPGNLSFTPQELLSSAIVQNYTGTAEGGPNWVEWLTGCGLNKGLTYPLSCDIQLWDFAFSGSNTAEEWLPLHHDYTIPLVNATQQWLNWAEPVVGRGFDKRKALVAIWIGINDINDSIRKYPNGTTPSGSLADLWADIIDTLFDDGVAPLQKAGYKNFLFLNLPPLQRTKAGIASSNPHPNKTEIDTYNSILAKRVAKFEDSCDDVKGIMYDANTFLNGVLDNPASYGIKNTTSFCPSYNVPEVETNPEKYGCLPIGEYFWFNSGHMSYTPHKAMAPDIIKKLKAESAKGGHW